MDTKTDKLTPAQQWEYLIDKIEERILLELSSYTENKQTYLQDEHAGHLSQHLRTSIEKEFKEFKLTKPNAVQYCILERLTKQEIDTLSYKVAGSLNQTRIIWDLMNPEGLIKIYFESTSLKKIAGSYSGLEKVKPYAKTLYNYPINATDRKKSFLLNFSIKLLDYAKAEELDVILDKDTLANEIGPQLALEQWRPAMYGPTNSYKKYIQSFVMPFNRQHNLNAVLDFNTQMLPLFCQHLLSTYGMGPNLHITLTDSLKTMQDYLTNKDRCNLGTTRTGFFATRTTEKKCLEEAEKRTAEWDKTRFKP